MIYEKGQVIVSEGDTSTHFIILMKGKIEIYKRDVKVSEYSETGGVIGEMSAILGKPRTATLIAGETTTVVPIPGDIDLLIKENPDVAKTVLQNLAKNLERMTNEYLKIASPEQRFEASKEFIARGTLLIEE
ncbi:MAG: cyclic nucleotide-binding domain-containing protein [Ignavibacteriaceae bacterium]|nr:cyclic nucleotide-binding domain-containing protein [Ignavibacteriaceae bacterium]